MGVWGCGWGDGCDAGGCGGEEAFDCDEDDDATMIQTNGQAAATALEKTLTQFYST